MKPRIVGTSAPISSRKRREDPAKKNADVSWFTKLVRSIGGRLLNFGR